MINSPDLQCEQRRNLELEQIPDILEDFGFGKLMGQPVRMKRGMVNHNLEVATTAGKHFIVRYLINPTITAPNLDNEVAIQQQLRGAGVGTIYYLHKQDDSFVFSQDGLRAVISEKLNGVHPNGSDENSSLELEWLWPSFIRL